MNDLSGSVPSYILNPEILTQKPLTRLAADCSTTLTGQKSSKPLRDSVDKVAEDRLLFSKERREIITVLIKSILFRVKYAG